MIMRWHATIKIELGDLGARDLYAMTGIRAPRLSDGTIDVEVNADSFEEAMIQALEQATALAKEHHGG